LYGLPEVGKVNEKGPAIRRIVLFWIFGTRFRPKAQPFSQPWATPRGRGLAFVDGGPTGQPFAPKNGWPVGPIRKLWCLVPLGVAQD